MSTPQTSPLRTPNLIVGGALLLINRLLLRSRLRRRVDGWRRAAGLVLRGEESTFVLSAFGLDLWSDVARPAVPSTEESRSHVSVRLDRFLLDERGCHIRVSASEDEDCAENSDGPCYSLAFEPWVDGPGRFLSPQVWRQDGGTAKGMGTGIEPLFNIVCRVGPEGNCDAWFRVNHVGTDGVPVQELLARLESAWGIRHPVVYPAPEVFAPLAAPRPLAGRDGLAEVQAFLDFSGLLSWRKRQNARLSEPMTVSAAFSWCLAQQPPFEALHIGSTVEVEPVDGLGRGVGLVVVRPADYAGHVNGLERFVRDFNRQVSLNRARASTGCRTLDAAALLPPRRAASLLRYALERDPRAFGEVGLTILKDAKVFGAPIAEVGHDYGFIAVGSVTLPTGDGRRVGCVIVKGSARHIGDYPARLQAAVSIG